MHVQKIMSLWPVFQYSCSTRNRKIYALLINLAVNILWPVFQYSCPTRNRKKYTLRNMILYCYNVWMQFQKNNVVVASISVFMFYQEYENLRFAYKSCRQHLVTTLFQHSYTAKNMKIYALLINLAVNILWPVFQYSCTARNSNIYALQINLAVNCSWTIFQYSCTTRNRKTYALLIKLVDNFLWPIFLCSCPSRNRKIYALLINLAVNILWPVFKYSFPTRNRKIYAFSLILPSIFYDQYYSIWLSIFWSTLCS